MIIRKSLAAAALIGFASLAFSQSPIDGTLSPKYGPAKSTQSLGTGFGDANLGQQFFCNGSELDTFHAKVIAGNLYIFLGGNMESNYNKLEVFIDCIAGGQNRLLANNPGVSFGALLRMGDDGSGNGLTFDAGFDADWWFSMTGGDVGGGTYGMFCDGAELLTAGGGIGEYLGSVSDFSTGSLTGGNNFMGALGSINNSNTAGVDGSNGGPSSGAGVTTGMEICIPLANLGNPTGDIKICAFINGGGHDFLSNQNGGSLPGGSGNLGEPRVVNFSTIAGDQFIKTPTPSSFAPVSVNLVEGIPFGGNLASLAASDDNHYFILNDESNVNARVQFGYTVSPTTASCLTFYVETSSDRTDQTVFFDLWNGSAYQNVGSTTTTTADSTSDVVFNTNASQWIGSGGAVRAQLRFIPFADLEAADGWSQRIDIARVEVSP